MATLYKTNGDVIAVYPANGETFTIDEMQKHIGGYVAIAHLTESKFLVCDEDGYITKRDQVNIPFRDAYPFASQIIVGDVLVASPREVGYADYGEGYERDELLHEYLNEETEEEYYDEGEYLDDDDYARYGSWEDERDYD